MYRTPQHRSFRTGFTLVEMLVTIALVLLMMTMFTEIFVLATGSMGTQRGIAENDQIARRIQRTVMQDLRLMTFTARRTPDPTDPTDTATHWELGISPFKAITPGSDPPPVATDFPTPEQRGYFYYREGDTGDETDDVLQFTMQVSVDAQGNILPTPFFARATRFVVNTQGQRDQIPINQPEADDSDVFWNANPSDGGSARWEVTDNRRGAGNVAEVVYFLRHGILYRRMMLIREKDINAAALNTLQMTTGTPGIYQNLGPNSSPLDTFWRDFDYSAYFDTTTGLTFHEASTALANNVGAYSTSLPVSLGNPKYRFGFGGIGRHGPGLPREFILDSNNANISRFIGRFTHEETSHHLFGYPGNIFTDQNTGERWSPVSDPNDQLQLRYNNTTGVVQQFRYDATQVQPDPNAFGTRRSHDIVLTDVVAFDIKLFDDKTGRFENLGHNTTNADGDPIGLYNQNDYTIYVDDDPQLDPIETGGRNPISNYGNRYDTWHPSIQDFDNTQGGGNPPLVAAEPPYRPTRSQRINGELVTVPVPLRAIQISIRYMDRTSNQMRSLTMIHSFAPREATSTD